MGKCYNVVLDSNSEYISFLSNSANSYIVNWDALMPDKAYKVSFSFITSTEAATDVNLMGIMVDLGCNNTYVSNDAQSMSTSNFLGFAELKDSTNFHYYYANQTTNPPIYISRRPSTSPLMVQLTNGVNCLSAYSTPYVNMYILTLHFEEID